MTVFHPAVASMVAERSGELRARFSEADPKDAVVAKWFRGGSSTEAGVYIGEEEALRVSTVYACVKVLSESVAVLPLLLRKDDGDQSSDEAKDYYLNALLKRRPNKWQTPIEFKQMIAAHVILRGAAYSRIVTGKNGKIEQLIPLNPDRTTPFMAPDGTRCFSFQPQTGGKQILLQDEVFYIPGMTHDGVKPCSVIGYAKETIGLAYATQQYGARFFKNNASPGGVIRHPGKMGDVTYQRIKEGWEARHQGGQNAHKVAILEEGMEWTSLGMTASDAQFVESRKVSPIEICQYFRMPPHKVQLLERSTNNNIENQSIAFVTDSLMPWLVKFEESANRDLLQLPSEQSYFYKFNVDEMLRGDISTRYTSYGTGLQNGFLSRNEVRQKEGMQPFDGGDEYLIQLNMGGADKNPKPAQKQQQQNPDDGGDQ